jgi:hypothetical protein
VTSTHHYVWNGGGRHAWHATVGQSGSQVTARNVGWNGGVATNASVSFGSDVRNGNGEA